MFRSRRYSLRAVFAGVLATTAGLASPQPAQAFTTSSVELVADVTVTGGIGYPVLTLGPQVPTLECLPLQTGPDNCHPVYDHPRPVAVSAIFCENEVENVDKLSKPPLHVGVCAFRSVDTSKPNPPENTVTGHCGLSGGQVSVLFTDALGQDFLLDIHFTTTIRTMVLDGHWFKLGPNPQTAGQHGLLVGLADDIPEIVPGGQNCTSKTKENFLILGTMMLASDPTL